MIYKKMIATIIFVTIIKSLLAQTDTIYTLNKAIAGTVVELGISEIRYQKPFNTAMNVVLPKCAVHKIKFANGEEMIIDSALVMHEFANDTSVKPIILTHLLEEVEGLKLATELEIVVPADYYYNVYKRPKQALYQNAIALANVHGAQIVYLPEEVKTLKYADEISGAVYGVVAKFYTTALIDYSIITNMITLDKEYKCQVEMENKSIEANVVNTPMNAIIAFENIEIKSNLCRANAKIKYYKGKERIDILVTSFDGDKFVGVYESGINDGNKKIIFKFIQSENQNVMPVEPAAKNEIIIIKED